MSSDPLAEPDADDTEDEDGDGLLDEYVTEAQKQQAKKILVWGSAFTVVSAVSLLVLWFSWTRAGPISTIAYVFFFAFGAAFLPMAILFGSPSFTNGMKTLFGRLHFILGQVAYGMGFLVQQREKWEMRPGRKRGDQYQVYLDDEWQDVDDGGNMSILGWKPFGILLNKTDDALREAKVKPGGSGRADGGTVERGGYTSVAPPSQASPGNWIIDLKSLVSPGVKRMADIDVIEKVEEITMRNEAKGGRFEGMEAIIGSVLGLIIGVATGYVMLGA